MSKKQVRKTDRKVTKYGNILYNDTGIRSSKEPTKFIMICNAGLVSRIDELLVRQVFKDYVLESVIMPSGKSYCFATFSNVVDAETAYHKVNGTAISAKMNSPVHLMYCTAAPEKKIVTEISSKPDGLLLLENFITENEEVALLSCIDLTNTSSYLGKQTSLKHRKVKHYGYEFNYDNNNVDVENPLPDTIPKECESIVFKKLKSDEELIRIVPWTPDQLTINEYQPGQGIPRHVDTHSPFESPIMSLSLGADVVMDFRHRDGRHYPLMLQRRSLLIMHGESRYDWTHGITPRKIDVSPSNCNATSITERQVRTSFTFRKLRTGPCQCQFPVHCDSRTVKEISDTDASNLESLHVHQVYEEISNHFSETRHKPWPEVAKFVEAVEPGGILIDVGCGNGKYLGINARIFDVGCDRSFRLSEECQTRGNEVLTCDCLRIPFLDNSVDAAISIAVIHHLATKERRTAALREMGRVLRLSGRGLVYVWAKDQEKNRKMSSYLKQDRKNRRKELMDEGSLEEESIYVSFSKEGESEPVFEGSESSCQGLFSLPVHTNRTQFKHDDLLVPWKLKTDKDRVFLRYYHVFTEGELEEMFNSIECLKVIKSYYDQGNWCVMFEKV